MRKDIQTIYINLIQNINKDSRTSVKSLCEIIKDFNGGVGASDVGSKSLFFLYGNR